MNAKVKQGILVFLIAVWGVFMTGSFVKDEKPDPIVWGFPGAVYFALYGRSTKEEKE